MGGYWLGFEHGKEELEMGGWRRPAKAASQLEIKGHLDHCEFFLWDGSEKLSMDLTVTFAGGQGCLILYLRDGGAEKLLDALIEQKKWDRQFCQGLIKKVEDALKEGFNHEA